MDAKEKKKPIIHSAVHKFSNYLQTIRRRYPQLDFDRKRLSCFDVNLSVIEKFNSCEHNLKNLEGYDDLEESIKQLIEEHSVHATHECIDLLGVYIAPTDNDKANILLSKEKIASTAKEYSMDFESLYNFIKIHEYAHACMCPILDQKKTSKFKRDVAYVIIEESLATAIALKKMKNLSEYQKIKQFVNNQPFQYSYGLILLLKHENEIEDIMVRWKKEKSDGIFPTKLLLDSFFKDQPLDMSTIRDMFIF